jgi:hypothetical protein
MNAERHGKQNAAGRSDPDAELAKLTMIGRTPWRRGMQWDGAVTATNTHRRVTPP